MRRISRFFLYRFSFLRFANLHIRQIQNRNKILDFDIDRLKLYAYICKMAFPSAMKNEVAESGIVSLWFFLALTMIRFAKAPQPVEGKWQTW